MKNLVRSVLALALALPLVAATTACDTSSKSSSGGLAGAGLGGTNPGTNNPGTNNPGTNNPGTNNPGTNNPGTTTGDASALVGTWGVRRGNVGIAWEFESDGTASLYRYQLNGTQASVSFIAAGPFRASGGKITFEAKLSSCPLRGEVLEYPYQITGNQLTITIDGMPNSYTKGDVPNEDGYTITTGCFDDNGNFTPREVMNI